MSSKVAPRECNFALSRVKKEFIDEHLTKIKGADAVLLANFTKRGIVGYVGANTLMEAAFAYALGKPIFILNLLGDQPCRPEVLGMQPEFMRGELSQLVDSLKVGEPAKAIGWLGASGACSAQDL